MYWSCLSVLFFLRTFRASKLAWTAILMLFLALGAAPVRANAAAEAAAAPPRLEESIKFHIWMRGEPVLTLRQLLFVAGIPTVPDTVAERYDLKLVEAVRQFQRREFSKSIGLPNPDTIARLNQIAMRAAATTPAEKPKTTPVPAVASAPSTAAAPAANKPAEQPNKIGKGAAKSTVACESHVATQGAPAESPMVDEKSVTRQREVITRYEAIVAAGGFAAVLKPPKLGYCLGQDDPAVATVVARLIADNYLSASYRGTTVYSQAVADAVKLFQDAQGLVPSGRVGSDTLAAMNVPVSERLAALRASLPRLEKILALRQLTPGKIRVVVNVASASVQVLNGTDLLAGYKAIVGRDERESPEFVSTIPDILIAPSWHAPRSIVARDISRHVRTERGYLEKNNMRVLRGGRVIDASLVNWRAGPLPDVEQRPGRLNALGSIRFGIGNGGRYYLHGTANPALLDRNLEKRFLSSGCVRLADPTQLAALLLRDTPDADGSSWTVEKLRARIDAHEGGWEPGQRIRLAKPVPVIWTYITGWVSRDGRVHFRPDRYERQSEEALQARRSPLDQVGEAGQAIAARSM
jgi:murein L,D-transpeptidase YcbB/YkuD